MPSNTIYRCRHVANAMASQLATNNGDSPQQFIATSQHFDVSQRSQLRSRTVSFSAQPGPDFLATVMRNRSMRRFPDSIVRLSRLYRATLRLFEARKARTSKQRPPERRPSEKAHESAAHVVYPIHSLEESSFGSLRECVATIRASRLPCTAPSPFCSSLGFRLIL